MNNIIYVYIHIYDVTVEHTTLAKERRSTMMSYIYISKKGMLLREHPYIR